MISAGSSSYSPPDGATEIPAALVEYDGGSAPDGADIGVLIDVDVGIAHGKATVWTCDLTHGYIDINGSYRT